ncbi:MAG: hypothetical protein KKD44_28795 [Proteobacteria bacterium]|nr:hypothetical protein [Pseudomonadota bacterium]
MRIKRFKCFIKEFRGNYFIVPKNFILRLFGVFPIRTAKGSIINPASNWMDYDRAKEAYNNMVKEEWFEI